MCSESKEAQTLLPFLEEVYSYEFTDTPDYFKLANILLYCLSSEGKQIDNIYDWNEEYELSKSRRAARGVQVAHDMLNDGKHSQKLPKFNEVVDMIDELIDQPT